MHIRLASFGALLFATSAVYGSTYYVAPTGIDTAGNGTAARPWKTLQYAITAIPDDGSTVLVRPGVYNGRIRMNRRFAKRAFLRSEVPYRAKLTAGSEALITVYGGANFELAGFEITRPAGATGIFLIHVQNVGAVAENIAHTSGGPDDAARLWLGSDAHRRNLMNCAYTHTGIGEAAGRWTQLFYRPAP